MIITEGAISINLPEGASAVKFDGSSHGLSHCMKAVDFVIDTPTARIYLEIKDPHASNDANIVLQYAEDLMSEKLDPELYYKYRDSWLYNFAKNSVRQPSYYLILIALDHLSTEALAGRSVGFGKKLSLTGPPGGWATPFVDQCFIFNLEAWNRSFPQLPATRI